MKRSLKPTVNSGMGSKNLKPKRDTTKEPGEMQRPTLPIDIENMNNVNPRQGKVNPTHVNFMFGAGSQTFEGNVAYGPLGKTRPGRIMGDTREIIGSLGNNAKRGL